MNMQARWMLGVLLMLAATGGCARDPITGQRQLSLISQQQEIAMGREAAPDFEKQFDGLVADPPLQRYVNDVGQQVAAASHRPSLPYEFGLLNSDVPNAFALPGGKIYVTAGLMRRMNDERQLAAVLAHEVGHVAAKHSVSGMQRQMGAELLVTAAGMIVGEDKAEIAKAASNIAANMALLRYSRQDEYEADRLGVGYLAKSGYNPWGLVELLEVLDRLHEGSGGGTLSEMFQTHPLTSERIRQAKAMVSENHPEARRETPDPNADRFQRMQSRLPKE